MVQFADVKRDDLVAKEQLELDIIKLYLPKQMDDLERKNLMISRLGYPQWIPI